MRVWTRFLLLLGILAAVGILYLSLPVPERSLLRRVARLEAQNSKLHHNLQQLHRLAPSGPQQPQVGMGTEPTGSLGAGGQLGDRCESVHIAMVVSGSLTIRRAVVLVKSILFYRQNPVHLHLLTSAQDEATLSTIFSTWQLPALNVSYYSLSDAIREVKWIPNSHYSGVFGLAKLTLVNVLPSSLDSVIVLDTDLMLAADIAGLWRYVRHLRKAKKLLALVENQSDWYLGSMWKGHKPWPAVGRGFNTGVSLLNLDLMRHRNWTRLWRSATEEALEIHDKTALADQDVINAVIERDRELVFVLPCVWNIQLSEKTLSDYCLDSAHHFKIVHWNSAAKLEVRNVHAPRFRDLYGMFEDYSSALLRTQVPDCYYSFSSSQDLALVQSETHTDPCWDVREEARISRRVHPYFLNYSYVPQGSNDVTLVTQMSVDRLHMLESLCSQWAGPLSVALYASEADLRAVLAHVEASDVLRASGRLGLHVVLKAGRLYPVNQLRNVALSHAWTPYVYFSDADFLPMPGLYHYLREAVRVLGKDRRALVVPAFESLLYRADIPTNKSRLLSMLRDGQLFTFRHHVWKQGHAPTDFDHWRTAMNPYRVQWAEDFEPYLVVDRWNVSRFDERFVGFGWNKVSHVMELTARGYELVVLPGAFMVHLPHAPSPDILGYRGRKHYRDCMMVLKREFQRELESRYSWKP